MRILHYNWADYRDPSGRGGGISVYQRATLAALARHPGVETVFLCAGLAQSLRPGPPRWEALPHRGDDPTRRFQLVDSLPLSPAHHAFGCPEQVEHAPSVAAFARFVAAEGPFDAIQFNTLEGLPASVLSLRAEWPETCFVVALHNYYPFCPQVNLWQRERAHCTDYQNGLSCVACLPVRRDPARLRRVYGAVRALDRAGLRQGTFAFDRLLQPLARIGAAAIRSLSDRRRAQVATQSTPEPDLSEADGAPFAARRAAFVEHFNTYADCVLAVSERTAELARGFGVSPDRIAVHRIGTDQAPLYGSVAPPARLPRTDGTLGVGYLGYMRRDKGFFFLLDALERMDAPVLARLHLTLAAQTRDSETGARIRALAPRLASLRHFEGYGREELDDVLTGVDLGLVPVLWEDNLPQVAMEMHARRIPLLTSDKGGARELGNCPDLVFRAGDAAAFEAHLHRLLTQGMDLAPYWANARPLHTPDAHAAALLDLYQGLSRGQAFP